MYNIMGAIVNKKNFLMMAVAKGSKSTEATEIKKFIGIAPCCVLAVNPTKAEIKNLMGFEPKEEPVYTGVQEIDGKPINYARITFVIKTDAEKCGIDTTQMMTFFIRNQYRKSSQSGKYQVEDEFGRTAWATEDVIKAKGKIYYKDGAMEANITTNYRPAFVGEEELTNFIKAYLNIPNPANYVNGTWIMKTGDELSECECRLDEIDNYFKGNFKEIKDAIALQPTNKVKVLFGIRTADDGREYQDVYNRTVLKNSSTNITALQKEIEDSKNSGGLQNRIYEFCDLKEYKVEATDFNNVPVADDPFTNSSSSEATPW